eukprot:sb/3478545/
MRFSVNLYRYTICPYHSTKSNLGSNPIHQSSVSKQINNWISQRACSQDKIEDQDVSPNFILPHSRRYGFIGRDIPVAKIRFFDNQDGRHALGYDLKGLDQ